VSTVGQTLTNLKALFAGVFDPADLTVEFGPRAQFTITGGRLRIGDVEGESEPEAMGPSRPMFEKYDVECIISLTRNTDVGDQEAITRQVLDWADVAELAVRASPSQTIGVPGVRWAVVAGRWDLKQHPASETGGPISSSFTFRVHVEANYRLT
jgi:hypothetical protein